MSERRWLDRDQTAEGKLILVLPAPIGRRTLDVALRNALRVTALPGATALRCEFDLPRRMKRVEKIDWKERAADG